MDDPGSTRDEPLEPPSPTIAIDGTGDTAAVEISDPHSRLPKPDLQWLGAMAQRAAAELGASGEARVRIVGDAEMDNAHRRYKGVEGTTDVLTFDYRNEPHPDGPVLDVDILVCADEAARHAAERGGTLVAELLLYIVHGMLHCLGHDDLTEPDAAAMHRREDEVLTAIGVGPVYGGHARGGAGGRSWS